VTDTSPAETRRRIQLPEPWAFPFPVETGGFRMSMGLRHIDPADWLLDGPDHHAQMAERQHLIQQRPQEVIACLPEAEAAAGELWQLVSRQTGAASTGEQGAAAMAAIGLRAQEDFCILQTEPGNVESPYRLTAAVLCFPNRWRPADKIGLPLQGIHGPVPGYAAKLGMPVDRFFQALKADRIAMRHNWSLHTDDQLFHPGPGKDAPDGTITAANAGQTVFMRVERQTLRRLPESGAVVFTIRTLIAPLAEAAETAEKRLTLKDALETMDPDMQAYKAMAGLIPPVIGWISQQG
jgi:dimethylamine monooxygenase subunit A